MNYTCRQDMIKSVCACARVCTCMCKKRMYLQLYSVKIFHFHADNLKLFSGLITFFKKRSASKCQTSITLHKLLIIRKRSTVYFLDCNGDYIDITITYFGFHILISFSNNTITPLQHMVLKNVNKKIKTTKQKCQPCLFSVKCSTKQTFFREQSQNLVAPLVK